MPAPKKPKITSSSNRSTRSTSKPVTQGQNPQRANRQGVSKAQVSSSQTRAIGTGARVTTSASNPKPAGMVNANKPTMRQIQAKADALRQRAQNPTPRGQGRAVTMPNSRAQGVNLPKTGARVLRQQAAGTTSPGAQARAQAQGQAARSAAQTRRAARDASQRMAGKLAKAAATRLVGTVARRAGLASVAAAGLQSYNTADGTLSAALKRGDYKPKQGPTPKNTTASFNKKSFDQAFKAARTSGAKVFTWRGKKYTTKLKGE